MDTGKEESWQYWRGVCGQEKEALHHLPVYPGLRAQNGKEGPENLHYCFTQRVSFQLTMVRRTETAAPCTNGYVCYLMYITVNDSYSQVNCWSMKELRLGKGHFLPGWNPFGCVTCKVMCVYIQEKTMPKYGVIILEGLFPSNVKQYENLKSLQFQGFLTPTFMLSPLDHVLTFICFKGKCIICFDTVNMVL